MKKRILSLMLIIALVALMFACQQDQKEPFRSEMLSQIARLPQDANFLGYFNYQQIRETPFIQLLLDSTEHAPFIDRTYQDFLDLTDFDFQKDIKDVYFAGTISGSEDEFDGLIVAFGKYNPEKIMNYVLENDKKQELTQELYAGKPLYHFKKSNPKEHKIFCFVDEKTFIGGGEVPVKAWLDKLGKEISANRELVSRLEKLPYKNHAWFTGSLETALKKLDQEKNFHPMQGMQHLRNIDVSFKFSQELLCASSLEASNPEKASLFRDTIKGAISTAKLSVSEDRGTVDVLNKIEVKQQKNKINVTFRLTKEDVKKLIEQKKKLSRKIV